jgi:hypothetical protein
MVIGISVQALLLALVIRVHKAYGTLDTRVLSEKIAAEIEPINNIQVLPESEQPPVEQAS